MEFALRRRNRGRLALALLTAALPAGLALPAQPASLPASQPAAIRPHAEFAKALDEIVGGSGGTATLTKLATTSGGRDVALLTIAAAGPTPREKRRAILIVGGIDAEIPASAELVARLAEQLAKAVRETPVGDAAKALQSLTFYVVPRLNADGVEGARDALKRGERVNAHSIDNDRDGVADEDGPNDLNGDNQITLMRVKDPQGDWLPDKDEPRLLKKADRSKGEKGIYKLMVEGIDDDKDGEANEDGPGGVDDDRNWPHLFESGEAEAGIHQLSEPETRALAEFVLAHRNIVAAIVIGRHDNLVSVPKGAARGPSGQDYRDLHPDDVKLFEHISEKFKDMTGLTGGPACKPDGALYSWLYNQHGIPTFATTPWWPIGEPRPPKPPASAPASGPSSHPSSGPSDGSQPAAAGASQPAGAPAGEPSDEVAASEAPERPARGARGGRGGRGGGEAGEAPAGGPPGGRGGRGARGGGAPGGMIFGPGGPPGGTPGGESRDAAGSGADDALGKQIESNDANKKWLKYSDEKRGKSGFVEWTKVKHPEFGEAEVGGFAPYFQAMPTADDASESVDRQLKFVRELATLLPAPRFAPAKVKDLGGGLWQVEVRLVNDALLPTHTAMSRHVRNPSWTIQPKVDRDRIVGGSIVERVPNIVGGGEAQIRRWIIRGRAGEAVAFRAFNRAFGEITSDVTLKETTPGQEGE